MSEIWTLEEKKEYNDPNTSQKRRDELIDKLADGHYASLKKGTTEYENVQKARLENDQKLRRECEKILNPDGRSPHGWFAPGVFTE